MLYSGIPGAVICVAGGSGGNADLVPRGSPEVETLSPLLGQQLPATEGVRAC